MKVGFVFSHPFGRSIGTDVRNKGLIEGLSSMGVEIHIITQFTDNIPLDGKNIYVHQISTLSSQLRISSIPYKIFKKSMNNSFIFKRLCRKSLLHRNSVSLGKSVVKIANHLDLDVLQAEQQIASNACVQVKNELSMPVVADFHGIWAEEMVASNIIEKYDSCYETLHELEADIACEADAVTVVSDEMETYVKDSLGAPCNKVFLIPNATFPRVETARYTKKPSKVIHSGTLHPWENVELFIKSIPYVQKRFPSASFYLTRKGAKLNKIMKLANELNLSPNFIWFERGTNFFNFLKSCDVGVISSTTHLARQMAYPAKLYDYLSVGLPIVANDIGGWTKIIKENNVGIVTKDTPESFAEGIAQLLENPHLINEYGQNGIDLVKRELNYYRSAEKLFTLYNTII